MRPIGSTTTCWWVKLHGASCLWCWWGQARWVSLSDYTPMHSATRPWEGLWCSYASLSWCRSPIASRSVLLPSLLQPCSIQVSLSYQQVSHSWWPCCPYQSSWRVQGMEASCTGLSISRHQCSSSQPASLFQCPEWYSLMQPLVLCSLEYHTSPI